MVAVQSASVIETHGLRRVFKSGKRTVEAVAGVAIAIGARAFSRAAA